MLVCNTKSRLGASLRSRGEKHHPGGKVQLTLDALRSIAVPYQNKIQRWTGWGGSQATVPCRRVTEDEAQDWFIQKEGCDFHEKVCLVLEVRIVTALKQRALNKRVQILGPNESQHSASWGRRISRPATVRYCHGNMILERKRNRDK